MPLQGRTIAGRHRAAAAVGLCLLALVLLPPAAHAQGDVSSINHQVEAAVKGFTLYLARFVEGAAAIVIGIASVRGIAAYFLSLARGQAGAPQPKEEIRLSLGRSLALALEFELGADILSTAVAPSWDEIGKLAAIAVIRTALNFFLERELRSAEARDPAAARRTMADAATR